METQQESDSDGTNNNSSLKLESQSDMQDDEGVWSADIEEAFQESLEIYPPCGRRKIILTEEGKMYGRNEMIARYIMIKTGKKRTRKQVSSHIQVLHRRQQREKQNTLQKPSGSASSVSAHLNSGQLGLEAVPSQLYTLIDRAAIAETSANKIVGNSRFGLIEFEVSVHESTFDNLEDRKQKHSFLAIHPSQTSYSDDESVSIKEICDKFPMTEENEIGLRQLYESGPSDSFYLIKFWADSDFTPNDNLLQKYEIASIFESAKSRQIEITTIVYSFSKQAVKKIQNASPHIGSQNRAVYRMNSDLCDYGKGFIEKLLLLSPDKTKMDLVLENFNVLYKVTDEKTQETLLVLALVFEVSKNSQGSTYNIYKFRS